MPKTATKTIPAAGRTVAKTDNAPPTREQELKTKHAKLWARKDAFLAKAAKADLKPKTAADVKALHDLAREGMDIANDSETIRKAEGKPFFEPYKEINSIFNDGVKGAVDPKWGPIKTAADKRLLEITREEQARADAEAERIRKQAEVQEAKAAQQEQRGDTRLADATRAGAEATHRAADATEATATADVSKVSATIAAASGSKATVTATMTCSAIVRADLELETLRPFLDEAALIKAVNVWLGLNKGSTLKGAVLTEKVGGRIGR